MALKWRRRQFCGGSTLDGLWARVGRVLGGVGWRLLRLTHKILSVAPQLAPIRARAISGVLFAAHAPSTWPRLAGVCMGAEYAWSMIKCVACVGLSVTRSAYRRGFGSAAALAHAESTETSHPRPSRTVSTIPLSSSLSLSRHKMRTRSAAKRAAAAPAAPSPISSAPTTESEMTPETKPLLQNGRKAPKPGKWSKPRLLSFEESRRLVPWATDNEFVTSGYRPQLVNISSCLYSAIGCESVPLRPRSPQR